MSDFIGMPRNRPLMNRIAVAAALLLLPFAFARLTSAAPAAPTYTVDDTADLVGAGSLTDSHCAAANGKCTLRAAVMEANHTPGGGATIILPSGLYTLTILAGAGGEINGDLNISTTTTLLGSGASSTIIDANGQATVSRAFVIEAGAVATLSGITIRHGSPSSFGGGLANEGRLQLVDSVIFSNTALPGTNNGGGIGNGGILTMTNSQLLDNLAGGHGGGLDNEGGTATLINSRVVGDHAGTEGGGLYNNVGTLNIYTSTLAGNAAVSGAGLYTLDDASTTLVASTVSSNSASESGGGLVNAGVSTVLVNSTVSGNIANGDAGGIFNGGCPCGLAETLLFNVTVADNQADADHNGLGSGGGISNTHSTHNFVGLSNSLLGGNRETQRISPNLVINVFNDCRGTLNSFGYVLLSVSSGCVVTGAVSTLLSDVDPLLGPLRDNGGPTLTQALLPGSPAIDAGNLVFCADTQSAVLTADQRGRPRLANGAGANRCDIGAFELQRLLNLPLVRR